MCPTNTCAAMFAADLESPAVIEKTGQDGRADCFKYCPTVTYPIVELPHRRINLAVVPDASI